ncbi:MAG: GNAT family N-acetyltransferase [Candidatus Bipolaricaulota bacterium]|nr:GNAT family N-acetyltransferase [Candidatus Bipolaricaulota bacterium]MDW8126477.1 GNAT family N-acetyltransferase [Candidatus Bipolaricaulota bacterium]
MVIRLGKLEDIDELAQLLMRAYQGLEAYGEESVSEARRYLKWLRRTCKSGFLVAEVNGCVVGFIAACPEWKDWELGTVLEIHEIVVAPEWQGKGVGRALLNQAYSLGHSHGRKLAALWVGVGNMKAREWYKKLGFKEIGRWGEWIRMFRPIPEPKDE